MKFNKHNNADYDEILLESLLNESILHFSNNFKDKLKYLKGDYNSTIARDLLELEGQDLQSNITYIDILQGEGEEGMISFLPINKLFKSSEDAYTNERRSKIRIGKFIKKVLSSYSEKQIEEFVNVFKSLSNTNDIKLVSGDEIKKWYKRESHWGYNYSELSNSCMVDKDYFDLYTMNPDVCQLLILTCNNKLLARALVWKVETTKGFEYYMDRVYSLKDYQRDIMIGYAKKRKWAYKKWPNDTDVHYDNKRLNIEMSVKVKKIKYRNYPYMDTFIVYDYMTGLLWNTHRRPRGYILHSIYGEHSVIKRNPIRKFSDYISNIFNDQ